MLRKYIFSSLLCAFFLLALTASSYAGYGHLKTITGSNCYVQFSWPGNDTLPVIKGVAQARMDSASKSSTIKEVPKSKKQLAPSAVPVKLNVQAIKIIKPKIIKPVIKVN